MGMTQVSDVKLVFKQGRDAKIQGYDIKQHGNPYQFDELLAFVWKEGYEREAIEAALNEMKG